MISPDTVLYEKSFPVQGRDFGDAGYVSTRVKTLLKKMDLPKDVIRRSAIVTYEAEMNICSYAERGEITVRVTPRDVTIEAVDEGQGIADIDLAMKEGYSTATEEIWRMGFGAGMGLGNMKHFADLFSISSEPGKGTHLKMIIHRQRDGNGT